MFVPSVQMNPSLLYLWFYTYCILGGNLNWHNFGQDYLKTKNILCCLWVAVLMSSIFMLACFGYIHWIRKCHCISLAFIHEWTMSLLCAQTRGCSAPTWPSTLTTCFCFVELLKNNYFCVFVSFEFWEIPAVPRLKHCWLSSLVSCDDAAQPLLIIQLFKYHGVTRANGFWTTSETSWLLCSSASFVGLLLSQPVPQWISLNICDVCQHIYSSLDRTMGLQWKH